MSEKFPAIDFFNVPNYSCTGCREREPVRQALWSFTGRSGSQEFPDAGKIIEAPEMVPAPDDAVSTLLPAEVSKYLELAAPIINKVKSTEVICLDDEQHSVEKRYRDLMKHRFAV